MPMSNYSGGRSKNDTSHNSSITQTFYDKLKGISSKPRGLVDPNEFFKLTNFIRDNSGYWTSRSGISCIDKYTTSTNIEPDSWVEFIPTGGTDSLFVFACHSRLLVYNNSTLTTLTYSGNADFLDSTKFKKCCAYNGNVYIVDGSQYIYKYDGTTVTRSAFPYVSDYGNPVTVVDFVGRLWLGTDENYVVYTTFNSDSVFEERILAVGTVSITSGTASLTGTNTIFLSSQYSAGDRLLITDGTNSNYVYISNIGSNTSITLNANINTTYTNANLFYIGNVFADSVGGSDGLFLRDLQPFGKNLAISKTSNDTDSRLGKLYVLQPSLATDPNTGLPIGATLLNRIDTQDNFTNIHPYSMEEYKGYLVYLADSKLKALQPSTNSDGLVLDPLDLGFNKLENILNDINNSNVNKSRISSVSCQDLDSLMVSVQLGSKVDTVICGFSDIDNSLIFSTMKPQTYTETGLTNLNEFGGYLCNFRDYILIMGHNSFSSMYKDTLIVDSVYDPDNAITCDTTQITCDSSTVIANAYVAQVSIYREFETGVTKNDNWNKLNVHKFNILTSENRVNTSLTPEDTYSLSLVLDNTYVASTINKEYASGSSSNIITFDSDYLFTFDSSTPIFDVTNINFTNALRHSWFAFVKSCNSVALRFLDYETCGIIKLAGYGYTLRINKYD